MSKNWRLSTLGAGYDCRAYRLPAIAQTRVFEVDHLATLARKRERLAGVLGRLPEQVPFVAIDFSHQCLDDVLRAAAFDRAMRAIFVCEGVPNYLSAEAVDAVLRSIVSLAAPASL